MSKIAIYDRHQPYNQMPLLPPPEEQIMTVEILLALNNANKALAELKGLARKLPNPAILVNTIALREAKASTQIENIFTTNEELYKALTIKKVDLMGNAKEVLFYRQALWQGFQEIQESKTFDIDLLLRIYQQTMRINDGIRPPQTETVIKKRGSDLLSGSVIYTPPRGKGIIEQKLDNLLDYLNDDQQYAYDPLIKMAVTHYQFEAIHPFRDGNGRTGRILNLLVLVQKGLLNTPILYLSAYIIRKKADYYYLLNEVTARRKWRNWLLYMLKAVEETAIYTIRKIEEIDRLFDNTARLVQTHCPNIKKESIERIFEQPYIRPKKLIGTNIKSINTAKRQLNQMKDLKILTAEKIGRETVYLNVDLYNLLSDI